MCVFNIGVTLTCSLGGHILSMISFIAGQLHINNFDARLCFTSHAASALLTRNHRSPHFSSRQPVTLIQRFALVSNATHQSDGCCLPSLTHFVAVPGQLGC